MPTISYFYGIYIRMYRNDHQPPHFHVKYNEFEASIEINTGIISAGEIPPRVRALTEEWRLTRQKEIFEAWELMVKFDKVKKVPGLK